MNPGYAGRTELPENLKTLFRSCAMVTPDMDLICENMLMSEGFLQAHRLSKKFTTLYSLSSELLSKQRHYDWVRGAEHCGASNCFSEPQWCAPPAIVCSYLRCFFTFDVGVRVQGLRATKAVLRVAGSLKRAEPKVDEDRILMRGQAQKPERGSLHRTTMRMQ
jgi:dynein heavy chain